LQFLVAYSDHANIIERAVLVSLSSPRRDVRSQWSAVLRSLGALLFACTPPVADTTVLLPYCGYISFTTHYKHTLTRTWNITLRDYRHFNATILYLDIPKTDVKCTWAYLAVAHQGRERRYCGRRRPWSVYAQVEGPWIVYNEGELDPGSRIMKVSGALERTDVIDFCLILVTTTCTVL
jgi:hypothetical protein